MKEKLTPYMHCRIVPEITYLWRLDPMEQLENLRPTQAETKPLIAESLHINQLQLKT